MNSNIFRNNKEQILVNYYDDEEREGMTKIVTSYVHNFALSLNIKEFDKEKKEILEEELKERAAGMWGGLVYGEICQKLQYLKEQFEMGVPEAEKIRHIEEMIQELS